MPRGTGRSLGMAAAVALAATLAPTASATGGATAVKDPPAKTARPGAAELKTAKPGTAAVPAGKASRTAPAPAAALDLGPPAVSCAFPRGACGFVGSDGRTVIQPDFDWAEPFVDGLARVKVAGRYGLIDRFGRFVVPPAWDHLSRFAGGVATVAAAGRHGLVDREGREALPAKYAAAYPIADGAFLVDVGPADPAADPGRYEYEEDHPPPARALAGRWGVMGAGDQWLLTPRFGEVRPFADGAPSGSFWGRPSHKWQLVSGRGVALTGAVYDQVETAIGGVAVVRTGNQWNAVDATGRALLPPDASAVRRRPDGLVSYQSGDRIGLVGRDGEVAVPPEFDRVGSFVGDRAPAVRAGVDVWIDGAGRQVQAPSAASEPPSVAEPRPPRQPRGRIVTCPDGLLLKAGTAGWSFVDRKWHPAVAGAFEAARCFVRGAALVVRPGAGQWTRIDRKGAEIAGPSFCRLPDYAADAAGTVGRQPACRVGAAADAASRGAGGGP